MCMVSYVMNCAGVRMFDNNWDIFMKTYITF